MSVLLLTVAGAILSLGFALFQVDSQKKSDAELRARLQAIQVAQQSQSQPAQQMPQTQPIRLAPPLPAASRPVSGTTLPASSARRLAPANSSVPSAVTRKPPSAVQRQRLSLPPALTGKRPDPPASYVVAPRPAAVARRPATVARRPATGANRRVAPFPKVAATPRPPATAARKTVPLPAPRPTVATQARPVPRPSPTPPGSSPASTQEPVYGDLQADDTPPATP